MHRVATSWKIIEAVLKEHAHSAYRALRPGARPAQIERLERVLGKRLPQAFVASLGIHDGMRGVNSAGPNFVNHMFLLPISEILQHWRMLWDLQQECEFSGDQVTKTRALKNDAHWREGWVPVMDFNSDKLVLDLDPGSEGHRGQLFLWYNNGYSEMRVVADSFTAWLDQVAEDLSRRRFTLDEFGGIQLDEKLTR